MTPLLQTRGLSRHYSGVIAVEDLDLDVAAGAIHAVIGPNGAGKTTLFNLLSGLVRPTAGAIHLGSRDITPLAPDARARLGIARTFQNIRIFGAMTVLENVLTGLYAMGTTGLVATVLRSGRFRREERAAVARSREALELVGLSDKAEWRAAALSYGDQRRLEIARAAVGEPRLMLIDEPAAGMNPAETEGLMHLMQKLNALGATILLVEHDMAFVMGIARNITVLNFGRRIFDGTPEAVRQDQAVIEAYLGHKVAARLASARA